ncbi:MAG TPA: hypothetical protein VGE29_15365 [Prosthecobacter sp.]
MGEQIHAINDVDKYDGQLNEVLSAASAYKNSVESNLSEDDQFVNKAAFISATRNYVANFVDNIALGLAAEVQLRAAAHEYLTD